MAAQQRFGPAQSRAGRLRPLSFPLPVLRRLLLPVASTSGSSHFRQLPLPPTPTGAPRRKRACRLPVSSVSVSSPSDPAVGRQARPDCLRAVGFGPGSGRQCATGPRGAPERRNAGLWGVLLQAASTDWAVSFSCSALELLCLKKNENAEFYFIIPNDCLPRIQSSYRNLVILHRKSC